MIFLFRKFKNLLLNLLNLILLLKFIADNHKYIPVIYDDSFYSPIYKRQADEPDMQA